MKFSKSSSRVLILSHFLLNPIKNDSAASTAIRNYLLNKTKKIVQIEQPFLESKVRYFYKLAFVDGKEVSEKKLKVVKSPLWVAYLLHSLIAFFEVFITSTKFDIAIACENLSFLAALPLRKIGIIKKLVYYSVDYVPERFGNPLVNSVYHLLDRLACYHSDVNWVVSKEQITTRFANGVKENKSSPFNIVPIGYRLSEIEVKPFNQIKYYNLIFVGTVRPAAGPQLIVEAMSKIVKRFPNVKVTFAGGGEYTNELKNLAKKLKVTKHLEFLGYIDRHKDLIKAVADKSIGLAPYVWDSKSISMTSDPAKIKIYLACGLPVITTKVATSWPIISKSKSGIVVDYDRDQLVRAVGEMLKSKNKYKKFKINAINLSKKYDVDRIVGNALNRIPD